MKKEGYPTLPDDRRLGGFGNKSLVDGRSSFASNDSSYKR